MIISASRRSDIPRYFSEWFIQAIRQGFCLVPNPFNPTQVTQVDLKPQVVTAIVFWSRFPQPLLPHLDFLDDVGYRYYFLITLNNYRRLLEPKSPSFSQAVACIQKLSTRLGAGRVVWRYDPIFFTDDMDMGFHERNFHRIATELKGSTKTVIISFLDEYRKTMKRFAAQQIAYRGVHLNPKDLEAFLSALKQIANENGMIITTCAEPCDYTHLGIPPARCIDDRLLSHEFGLEVAYKKDPSQRPHCHCTVSKDIGTYNTCRADCIYCYAIDNRSLR